MTAVRIVEVGPRDGLQNEPALVPTDLKLRFIRLLVDAGLTEIEATSFVSPKWVPQLGDAEQLWPRLPGGAKYSALVPNARGLERALACEVRRLAFFTAASEAFNRKNVNMGIAESLAGFEQMMSVLKERGNRSEFWVRGYVSTAFECPYSGRVEPKVVVSVCRRLIEIGVDEVSVGDTIGVAVPREVRDLTRSLFEEIEPGRIAYHFHDTRGTAVANVAEALELGVRCFDSSAGGLGGCPYAPGAGGNLATEDLVYFLDRSGIETGVSLEPLAMASLPIFDLLGRPPQSKAQIAALSLAGPSQAGTE